MKFVVENSQQKQKKQKKQSMKQYQTFGSQKSVKNVKMKRSSQECKFCNIKNCKVSSSIALFEKQNNVEIDCWLREYNKKFITGYHLPISMIIDSFDKKHSIIKWTHLLNDKFSVYNEIGINN